MHLATFLPNDHDPAPLSAPHVALEPSAPIPSPTSRAGTHISSADPHLVLTRPLGQGAFSAVRLAEDQSATPLRAGAICRTPTAASENPAKQYNNTPYLCDITSPVAQAVFWLLTHFASAVI